MMLVGGFAVLLLILGVVEGVTPTVESTTSTGITGTTLGDVTTTLKDEGTTCSANSTCNPLINVTTVAPTTTTTTGTTTISTTTTTTTKAPKSNKHIEKKKQRKGCSCNLNRHICDINCCCDLDCTNEDRLVFSHCEREENKFYDTRYCDYIKYIYINNTEHEWNVNENGLFCVIRSNFPASYNVQRKQPLKSLEEVILQKTGKYSWFSSEGLLELESKDFIHGHPLEVIRDNKRQRFELDINYFTNTCNSKKSILYLEDLKTSCSFLDVSSDNSKLNLRYYYENISIVGSPLILNTTSYEGCPKNVCVPIAPKICDENFNVCVNITKIDRKLDVSCQYDVIKNVNSCRNVVKKVLYRLHHNGTYGIKRAEVLLVLNLVKYGFGNREFEHYIDFEVNFRWFNTTTNFSTDLSGSPGYNIGAPILVARLINLGNDTHFNYTLERNPIKYIDNFLVVPKNINGACVLNDQVFNSIEFGYSLMTKCRHRDFITAKKGENASNICQRLNSNILNNWLVKENVNRSFGLFGNADQKILEDWWPIFLVTSVTKILNETTGNFTKNDAIRCFNLIDGAELDIYHSRIDYEDLVNQEKILAITYNFTFKNITFPYNRKINETTKFEIQLNSKVMFYDITAEKKRRFVDPPKFEIKLPYDFFYPFIRVHHNSACKLGQSLILLLSLVLFII